MRGRRRRVQVRAARCHEQRTVAARQRRARGRVRGDQPHRPARAHAVPPTLARVDVHLRGEPVAAACRQRTGHHVDGRDRVERDRAEHAADVVRVEQRHPVQRDQRLVRAAAAHVQRA